MPDGMYRLEYNEKQQHFHYDCGNHAENTFGWVTLAVMPDAECSIFYYYMEDKYPNGFPELSVVQKEFDLFVKLKEAIEKNLMKKQQPSLLDIIKERVGDGYIVEEL